MHELGIVFHIVKTVENIALENQAEKVRKVVLQIGEVINDHPILSEGLLEMEMFQERTDGWM